VETRNWHIETPTGAVLMPRPSPPRQQLWYPHQNLAGHSIASAGLAGAILSQIPIGAIGISSTALVALFFTHSRAAWLAMLVGSTSEIVWSYNCQSRLRRRNTTSNTYSCHRH